MSPLRSLRHKLAFIFFLVTAAAFTVIWFVVVPQLEQNLKERAARQPPGGGEGRALRRSSCRCVGGRQPSRRKEFAARIRAAADATDARVTVRYWQREQTPERNPGFYPVDESDEIVPFDEALARQRHPRRAGSRAATAPSATRRSAWSRSGSRSPGRLPRVAFYSRDFDGRPGDGRVRPQPRADRDRRRAPDRAARRLPRRGAARAGASAGSSARRATWRAGSFVEPLPVTSKDEIGQLTDTFNRMQEQLRRVDVARKEFIATASHELRTPIFSLGGFVELLQDEDLDEDTRREFLETMSEQVERLQKLSVDLLDLSRLDSGSVELHTEPVDLAELTRSVAGEFHPRLAEHGTELGSTCRRRARAPAATANGSLRSCVSCSTTPSATRRRART